MCLFPIPNKDKNGYAYKHGITEFECGSCPECLSKRSSVWALRCVAESKNHISNYMITLTYDTFKYDKSMNIIGENPVNPNIVCNKKHIQDFIKRLRKWQNKNNQKSLKYICTSEYGSTTHRAHYHLIIFGLKLPDVIYYKKSKRGNIIYMSKTLTDIWKHGICTIDCKTVTPANARYCTKYCAKTRSPDTFFLCSNGIGIDRLYDEFNGISYWLDGNEYPIPKGVWQKYIINKYKKHDIKSSCDSKDMTYKYKSKAKTIYEYFPDGKEQKTEIKKKNDYNRKCYINIRDNDTYYKRYIQYWKRKSIINNQLKQDSITRIQKLPSVKYEHYKTIALRNIWWHIISGERLYSPYSNSGIKKYKAMQYIKFNINHPDYDNIYSENGVIIPDDYQEYIETKYKLWSLAECSRQYTASDTEYMNVRE